MEIMKFVQKVGRKSVLVVGGHFEERNTLQFYSTEFIYSNKKKELKGLLFLNGMLCIYVIVL
jgi:hypothetical protein